MNTKSTRDASHSNDSVDSGERWKSLVSLVIFIHLILLALCLSSNVSRSMLQARLLQVCAPYVQMLNLNLDFTPYHLTHGTLEDVDHRIEVLPEGADAAEANSWVVLPDKGWRGSDRYKRYQRLAKALALVSEAEEQSGAIARDVGEHFVYATDIHPIELRARQHTLQHWRVYSDGRPEARDPNAPLYFQTPYDADLIVTDDGTVFPNKKSSAGETARVGESEGNTP